MAELRCVCSKIRVSITKRNIWGFSWRKINDISVTALPPPFCSLSGCPGAVWFYTISFTRDCNGWARLKTNRRPIKCKGFLGESPVTGPTTRFTYSHIFIYFELWWIIWIWHFLTVHWDVHINHIIISLLANRFRSYSWLWLLVSNDCTWPEHSHSQCITCHGPRCVILTRKVPFHVLMKRSRFLKRIERLSMRFPFLLLCSFLLHP